MFRLGARVAARKGMRSDQPGWAGDWNGTYLPVSPTGCLYVYARKNMTMAQTKRATPLQANRRPLLRRGLSGKTRRCSSLKRDHDPVGKDNQDPGLNFSPSGRRSLMSNCNCQYWLLARKTHSSDATSRRVPMAISNGCIRCPRGNAL